MTPNEMAAVLREHPAVRNAAVISREILPGELRLVGYVVPETTYLEHALSGTEEERKRLQKWRKTFDLMQFAKEAASAPMAFNIAGWNSSYTRKPIPAEEMREWVDETVKDIVALHPKEVLEIGCGTGLLLLRLAPMCNRYVGADQSNAALQRLKEQLAQPRHLSDSITLLERSADNFEGLRPDTFDTVIINSVVQYFPSVSYLARVLEKVVEITKPGGKIFVGDIRSLLLMETFAFSVELFQAPASMTAGDLRERVLRRIRQQEELLLSPSFFLALQSRFPKISRVEIRPKRGHFDNEMTRFRYDAIISVAAESEKCVEPEWVDWSTREMTLNSIREALAKPECDMLGLTNIPNARLQPDVEAIRAFADLELPQTVAPLKEYGAKATAKSLQPQTFCDVGDDLGFSVNLSWMSGHPNGHFDVLFGRKASAKPGVEPLIAWPRPATVSKNLADHANTPGQTNLFAKLNRELLDFVKQKFPAETTAAEIVLVDALPSTESRE